MFLRISTPTRAQKYHFVEKDKKIYKKGDLGRPYVI